MAMVLVKEILYIQCDQLYTWKTMIGSFVPGGK